jgi:cytidylate kinase
MPIVTIRGQSGSGDLEIAKEVARILPSDYIDQEIIQSVASLVGHPIEQINRLENTPIGLVQQIKTVLEGSQARTGNIKSAYSHTWQEPMDDTKYLDALKSVVEDLALNENIVIHGRGSQFILHNNPSALHVLVVAPTSLRIDRVMKAYKIGPENARMKIKESDNSRRVFIQRFFNRDIEDPEYYDLVVNTEHLTYEITAQVIVKAVHRKSPFGKL